MPRRVSSIDPAKYASAKNFWYHAQGRNTAKPALIEEMKTSNFKPQKLDRNTLSEVDEGSTGAESLNESRDEVPEKEMAPVPEAVEPEPESEPEADAPETKPEENGVGSEEEECICNNVPEKQAPTNKEKDDLLTKLIEKVAELQNSLAYREVENLRLDGYVKKMQLELSKSETMIDELEEHVEELNSDKDSLNKIIETVEHNAMNVEKENRELRTDKRRWEREKKVLENSLEEARAETRLLDSQQSFSNIRHSSPIRRSVLDSSMGVIEDLNLEIDKLNSEKESFNRFVERTEQKARDVEEENMSLRRNKLQVDLEKRDLESSLDEAKAESRYLEDRLEVSRSLVLHSSPNSRLYTPDDDDDEVCPTCKCHHSTSKSVCLICNRVHKSPAIDSSAEVCPVCYRRHSKCPRSPRNVSFSEYKPIILSDLSRTF